MFDLVGIVERPLQYLHATERSTNGSQDVGDPEVSQKCTLYLDEIRDREERKLESVRRAGRGVDARWPRRSLTASQEVRADNEEAIGVDRFARADQRVPPARVRGIAVVAGRVGVTRQGMADHNDVVVACGSLAICLVRHLDGRKGLARVEHERVVLRKEDNPLRLNQSEGACWCAARSHRDYAVAFARA